MDEIQEFNINSSTSGIKLFGATISVNKTSPSPSSSSSQTNVNDDPGQSPTTVEHKKRPDKNQIIPCPRCKSMETKFCYFNNYDVNQPRHFCKGCRRYWTAGGALRNVPEGASRRKARPPCKSVVVVEERVLLENSGVEEVLDVAGKVVAEGWHVVEDGGVRRRLFPAKRRRCGLE